MFRRAFASLAAVIAIFAAVAASEQAFAVGYWNVPGNFCQWHGYGFGAGYHAKLVLGPITCWDCFAHNEVRLPCALQPPYSCYCQSGCNCGYGQPSVLAPSAAPLAMPAMTEETYSPVPVEAEENVPPGLEPDDVQLEPDSSPAERTYAPPPPSPAPQSDTSFRPLFGPPVER
jgi:hypothetical protein